MNLKSSAVVQFTEKALRTIEGVPEKIVPLFKTLETLHKKRYYNNLLRFITNDLSKLKKSGIDHISIYAKVRKRWSLRRSNAPVFVVISELNHQDVIDLSKRYGFGGIKFLIGKGAGIQRTSLRGTAYLEKDRGGGSSYLDVSTEGMFDLEVERVAYICENGLLKEVDGLDYEKIGRFYSPIDSLSLEELEKVRGKVREHTVPFLWKMIGKILRNKVFYYPGSGYDFHIVLYGEGEQASYIFQDPLLKDFDTYLKRKDIIQERMHRVAKEKAIIIPTPVKSAAKLRKELLGKTADVLICKGSIGPSSKGLPVPSSFWEETIFRGKTYACVVCFDESDRIYWEKAGYNLIPLPSALEEARDRLLAHAEDLNSNGIDFNPYDIFPRIYEKKLRKFN